MHAIVLLMHGYLYRNQSGRWPLTLDYLRWERHLIYTKGQLQFYGRLKACIFREIFSSLFNMHLSIVNYYNQTFFIAVQYYSAFKSTMFAGNISQHQFLSRWSINGQCFPLPKYARIRSEEEWWVLLIL